MACVGDGGETDCPRLSLQVIEEHRHADHDPFKVVRTAGYDEIVARANNLLVGRAAEMFTRSRREQT